MDTKTKRSTRGEIRKGKEGDKVEKYDNYYDTPDTEDTSFKGGALFAVIILTIIVYIVLFMIGYCCPITIPYNKNPNFFIKFINGLVAMFFFIFWLLAKLISMAVRNSR